MTDRGETMATEAETRRRSRRGRMLWSGAAVLVLAAITVAVVIVAVPQSSQGVEPGINKAMATLLQLDDITSLHEKAPGYRLTDQHGDPMTADEFHGRAVVLTVNDDQCEDLCTLLAQDVVAADRDLGAAARHVAFVSINANPYFPAVKDVAAWTDDHHLGSLKNWYFGTAEPAALKAVWHEYGVPVELDPKSRTVEHGSEVFFISPTGKEIALGQFGTESANTAPYAHAMAQMAVDLLPSSQRSSVSGPVITADHSGGALSSTPAPIRVADLREPSESLSTASGRGRYTVLNFWSSTCTACVQELPDLQKAHEQLGSKVRFLGDDVADVAHAGLAFAAKSGVTYPLLNDSAGKISGQYRISGLPYTVVLGPQGTVLIRHAGRFTTEQLVYVLNTLEAEGGNDGSGMDSTNG